jgi:dihydrolipoamide dehydrogenase
VKVVVLGGGSTGEHFVGALRRFDDEAQITLVESRLVGGECSYFACMPTKTMLRATELASSLERAPGLQPERPDADGVWSWRDWMTSDWDDSGQLHYLEEWRCRLVRGEGRVARPGVVEVDGSAPAAFGVSDSGRGGALPELPADPTVRLTMDRETFVTLAGGRRTPDDVSVLVAGDEGLAARILAAMAMTP